ncbi:MAG: phosphoribosylaminoimidazolesuccinocarboxamide synthase [Planctomycetota bacterium]|nr:phosphoribosylaminoimidazolesuccinocarboxamide synthase [Planctomycetota bacterium]
MPESSAVTILRESSLPGLDLVRRGKVRDIYDVGDGEGRYLIVASDRLSAFDVVLPGGIPEKGRVLTQLSLFWFDLHAEQLEGRIMLVEKLEILPVECIVRGYLAGSGWQEYQKSGSVCSLPLPDGLQESSELPEVIFTPSTKADEGHDEAISFEEMERIVGEERAADLRERSIRVYRQAAAYARSRGIIVADTKFEWGVRPGSGEVVLADEVLTPDSSRFWPADEYVPGRSQASFDKQYVRDYLLSTDWNRQPPAPDLPEEVVRGTSSRYREIYERLTGRDWPTS